jgi:hypothetical protein
MNIFPKSIVLRGFCGCDALHVRLAKNPCAALRFEKISHLWDENILKLVF